MSSEETSSNGALIRFTLGRILSGRTTYTAELVDGHWPDREELIQLADGGGELAAFFGGAIRNNPDGTKEITVYTD